MYHIAIVEDEKVFAGQLQEFLKKYQKEQDTAFKISVFEDGAEILEHYEPLYDVILLDIEMPRVSGMEAAGWGCGAGVYYQYGVLCHPRI